MMESLILVLSVAVLSIASIGLGSKTWKWVTGGKSSLENIILWFFAGEVGFSTIWILISLLIKFPGNTFFILVFIIPFFVLGFKIMSELFPVKVCLIDKINKIIIVLLCLLISGIIILAFNKPYEWDEVAYHFPALQEVTDGKIRFPLLQNNPYIYFYSPFSAFYGSLPYASEAFASIIYAMSFRQPASAHIIYLVNFVLFLVLINIFLKNEYGVSFRTNLIVDILILLNHGIFLLLSTGLIDINIAIYQLLSILLMLRIKKNFKLFYLSLFFIAFAIGQKYTAVYPIPLMLAYIIFTYVSNRKFRIFFKHPLTTAIKFIVISVLGGGFWYIKNLILYRNPVFPLYFGHPGINITEYRKLTESLIFGLRGTLNLSGLISTIRLNYAVDVGLILSITLTLYLVIAKRIKLNFETFFLIFMAVFLYLLNFYFGSQLSRYVLLTPMLLYFISSLALEKSKIFAIVILIISLLAIRFNGLQWSVWKPRFTEMVYLLSLNTTKIEANNVGCAYNVSRFLTSSNEKAINHWDPYAAVFYQNDHIFVYPVTNVQNFEKNKQIAKYLYINSQYKKDFIEHKDFHSDIDIDSRIKADALFINGKTATFVYGHCLLYTIN